MQICIYMAYTNVKCTQIHKANAACNVNVASTESAHRHEDIVTEDTMTEDIRPIQYI